MVKIPPDLKDAQIEEIANILLSNKIEAAIISNTSDSTREGLKDNSKTSKGRAFGKAN